MIELYSGATPNGHMVRVLLEECGLAYRMHAIDLLAGSRVDPTFLQISPGGELPALIDPHGPDGQPMALFGSGVCLVYLAVKAGRFLPADSRGRYEVLQWLMLEIARLAPLQMQAQTHAQKSDIPPEAARLCPLLEQRLGQSGYIGGADYGIADMALYPWLRSWQERGIDWAAQPRLRAWFDEISARPAVQRGCNWPADLRHAPDDASAHEPARRVTAA